MAATSPPLPRLLGCGGGCQDRWPVGALVVEPGAARAATRARAPPMPTPSPGPGPNPAPDPDSGPPPAPVPAPSLTPPPPPSLPSKPPARPPAASPPPTPRPVPSPSPPRLVVPNSVEGFASGRDRAVALLLAGEYACMPPYPGVDTKTGLPGVVNAGCVRCIRGGVGGDDSARDAAGLAAVLTLGLAKVGRRARESKLCACSVPW